MKGKTEAHIQASGPSVTDDRTGMLHTAVCVLTRNRPHMLQNALDSLSAMRMPEAITLMVVVVENNEAATAEATVHSFSSKSGVKTNYTLETSIGIPFARNRAVDIAMANGSDVVLFIDDDEIVTRDWLVQMVKRYRESDLQLIGGPVFARAGESAESWIDRLLWSGIARRYERKAAKAFEKHLDGVECQITIVTNNWLASREVFEHFNVRFDSSYATSGGSDTKFYHDAISRGVHSGWAPDAKIFEIVPPERATISYIYKRGRDQRRVAVYRKRRERGWIRTALRLTPEVIYRTAALPFGLIVIALTRGAYLADYTRFVGGYVGIVSGLFGARSTLYASTTGS